MKIIGIMPARNEEWVIGLSARAHLMWCDELVVLNHASTDGTAEILKGIDRVHVLEEADPCWYEMAHRQRLLEEARRLGATRIGVLDADEVLCGDCLPHVRNWLGQLMDGTYVRGPMKNLHRSIDRFRNDGSVWSKSCPIVAFSDHPSLGWQSNNGYDHHHRGPSNEKLGGTINVPTVMHLQFAHWRRLRAKHALYKVTERIRWPHKAVQSIDEMYNMALNEDGLGTSPVPPSWWEPYKPLLKHLRIDQNEEQWQEAEARRLVAEHGEEMFAGLNLFGVA